MVAISKEFGPRSPDLPKKVLATMLAVGAFTGLFAGCSADQEASGSPSATNIELDPFGAEDLSPCVANSVRGQLNRTPHEEAEQCIELQGNAETIFVYDSREILTEDAEMIARGLEDTLEGVTGGLLNIEPIVVPISDEVRDLYEELTPDGCIGTVVASRAWLSGISAKYMLGLEGDKIVGLNHLSNCHSEVGGQASYSNNRNAEIFGVNEWLRQYHENGDSWTRETIEEGYTVTTTYPNPADIAAHEVLHLFGIEGHGGVLRHPDGQLFLWKGSINLREYVRNSEYIEYGDDGNMMGNRFWAGNKHLNKPQMFTLQNPYRVVGKSPESSTPMIEEINLREAGLVDLELSSDGGSQMVVLELNASLPVSRDGEIVEGFSEIAITLAPDKSVEIFLMDREKGGTIRLGKVQLLGEQEYAFDIDGGILTIKANGGKSAEISYIEA